MSMSTKCCYALTLSGCETNLNAIKPQSITYPESVIQSSSCN